MAEFFVSSSCAVIETNKSGVATSLLVALVGVALYVGCVVFRLPRFLGFAVYPIPIGLALAMAFSRWGRWPARERGALEATAGGVTLDGRELVARAAVGRGLLRRIWGGKPRVRCLGYSGRMLVEVEVPTEQVGRALIAAARMDGSHGVTSFRLVPELFGRTWFALLLSQVLTLAVGLFSMGVDALLEVLGVREGSVLFIALFSAALVGGLLAGTFAWRGSRTILRIGPDGIFLRHFGRRHFIRFPDVSSIARWPAKTVNGVEAASEGFDLVLRSGRRFRLRTLAQRVANGYPYDDYIALELERAIDAQTQQGARGDLPFDGPSEPLAEWIAEVRQHAGHPSADYRHAAWSRARLWDAVEDPDALPPRRATCAIALSGSPIREGDQTRLRAVAWAIAMPALRDAVMAAADGNDESLQRALCLLIAAED